jgi:hypothetical protein
MPSESERQAIPGNSVGLPGWFKSAFAHVTPDVYLDTGASLE